MPPARTATPVLAGQGIRYSKTDGGPKCYNYAAFLVVQHFRQRLVHFQPAILVVMDVAKLAELIH
jgi:hypothetical protein